MQTTIIVQRCIWRVPTGTPRRCGCCSQLGQTLAIEITLVPSLYMRPVGAAMNPSSTYFCGEVPGGCFHSVPHYHCTIVVLLQNTVDSNKASSSPLPFPYSPRNSTQGGPN